MPPQVQAYEIVDMSLQKDAKNKSKGHKAIEKPSQHPCALKPKHQTPPEDYISPVSVNSKKSDERVCHETKPEVGGFKDKKNTYQALIPQQKPTDEREYQSLTQHTMSKEYYNIPPVLPPKPQGKIVK